MTRGSLLRFIWCVCVCVCVCVGVGVGVYMSVCMHVCVWTFSVN